MYCISSSTNNTYHPLANSLKGGFDVYNIEYTLSIMPYICITCLLTVLVVLEVRDALTRHSTKSAPAIGGFIPPPGDGYEYFVSQNKILYIKKRTCSLYRVYLVRGNTENIKVRVRSDKYGNYISIHGQNSAAVEEILDNLFQTNGQ